MLQKIINKLSKDFFESKKLISKYFSNTKRVVFFIAGILLSIGVWLGIVVLELDPFTQWIIFTFWLTSLLCFFISFKHKSYLPHFLKTHYLEILGIILIATLTRFYLIDIYPFVTIGDMVRDGGWDAARLLQGEIENIFGYSRYQSHGYIVNMIVIPFYWIFENSALSFKFATAIISIFDILVVYYIGERYFRRGTGLIASLVLISASLHLFYARTEIVVISASLITSIILLNLYSNYNKPSYKNIFLTSLLIGFSLNFYSALKPVAIIALFINLFLIVKNYVKNKNILLLVVSSVIVFVMIVIGFGPRLIYTTPEIFLNSKRITTLDETIDYSQRDTILSTYQNFATKYPKSLMIYFYENSQSHYNDAKPLLQFSLGIFFLTSVISWLRKKRELLLMIPFILLLPFTNSAITDIVNADHRTTLLLTFASLAVANGFIYYFTLTFRPYWLNYFVKYILILFLVFSLLVNVYNFFENEAAGEQVNNSLPTQEYLLMYTNYTIDDNTISENICLSLSPENYEIFDVLHFKEQFNYFNPGIEITLNENYLIAEDNVIFISDDCPTEIFTDDFLELKPCDTYSKYKCPKDKSQLYIYLEKSIINK